MGKLLDKLGGWIGNKLTELSIRQIPEKYSKEDEELVKKWKGITGHISNSRKKLLTSKMLESTTQWTKSVAKKEEVVEKEHKKTKKDEIMEFFSEKSNN